MSSITIAIPTYNRNAKLVENLARLLPLISNEKVIIIDNCSDVPVEYSSRDLINKYAEIDIKIYRNKTNIGITANFLRCFEYCESEWLWILSDDDAPRSDSLDIIRKDTKEYSDHLFFNYASTMVEKDVSFAMTVRSESFHITGLNDFIAKFDSFVNTIFISSGVYNVQKVLPSLRIGYIYSYSLVPHLITVLHSLGETNKAFFSIQKLVDFDPPSDRDTWSRLTFCQVIPILLEVPLPINDATFNILVRKITAWYMSDFEIYWSIASNSQFSQRKKEYIFTQIMARTIFKERGFKQKARLVLFFIRLFWFSKKKNSSIKSINTKHPLARI